MYNCDGEVEESNSVEYQCPMVFLGLKNPLAFLLSRKLAVPQDQVEEVITALQKDILDPASLSPLAALLGPSMWKMAPFEEGDIERVIMRLLLKNGAVLYKPDLPRILLLSDLGCLKAMIEEGVLPPAWLVDPAVLQPIRIVIELYVKFPERRICRWPFGSEHQTPQMVAFALLANQCGVLDRPSLNMVMQIIRIELRQYNLSEVMVLKEMYEHLPESAHRSLPSLQQLCRAAIRQALQLPFIWSAPRLHLPNPIRASLCFADIDLEGLKQQYLAVWRWIYPYPYLPGKQ